MQNTEQRARIDMESISWDAYLLDGTKVDKLHAKGVKLNTMTHEEIIKLKSLGPIEVDAITYHQARKAFFGIISKTDWWPKQILFTHIWRYIYVKNHVDNRTGEKIERRKEMPDIKQAFEASKQNQEGLVNVGS